jgi:DNA-directed RNA polymerase specialized sigma24 family protein
VGGEDEIKDETVCRIEHLLSSQKRDELELGFVLLDFHFRKPVSGYIRRSLDGHGLGWDADILASIWQETLRSIKRYIDHGEFEPRGELMGLLLQTAAWRTKDLLRKTKDRIDRSVDVEDVAIVRFDDPQVSNENLAMIRAGFDDLPQVERVVLVTHVSSKLSRRELTAAVNKMLDSDYSETAVKSILQRARSRMSYYLQKKGYFDEG